MKNVKNLPRLKARKQVKKKDNSSRIVFTAKYNPRGPDVKKIVMKHINLIENQHYVFPKGSIMVSHKRENNLKDLLVRSNPYKMKADLMENKELGYVKCNRRSCDSCHNYVDEKSFIVCHATKRKFKIRRESTCMSRNVIYVAYCTKCGKQGVGSTVCWKSRLSNYKSHIKNKISTCKIVKNFINACPDPEVKNLRFIIVDLVNNGEMLDKIDIEALLLKKEKFWIGTLVTQHQGLNGSHDWNRSKRTDRDETL